MVVRMSALKSDRHLENDLSGCFNWYARLGSNQRLSAPEAEKFYLPLFTSILPQFTNYQKRLYLLIFILSLDLPFDTLI
jgi:hypothetical protein